jgi:[acyl-carrier-protein] S-malonyltransferase
MKTMFMFPGQGSQVLKMGLEVYTKYSVAKEVFHQVDDALNYKLSDIIFGDDNEKLLQTQNTQPALMAVSMAVLKSLEHESGKKASEMSNFVAGHSLGEYSALCCSGVLSLADAAKLLQIRGQAMAEACTKNSGGMIALLGVDIAKAQELCDIIDGIIVVANDNSVGQIVISGNINAIETAIAIAPEIGIKKAVKLAVNGAFHSPLMQAAQAKLQDQIAITKFNAPTIDIIANVTAQIATDVEQIKKLLIEQITAPVKWRETLLNAQKMGVTKMVEIGSGKVLAGLAKRTVEGVEIVSVEKIEEIEKYIV